MKKIKVGINGMGRIGRNLARAIYLRYADLMELTAINDLVNSEELAKALSRDSTYGKFPAATKAFDNGSVTIGGKKINVYSEKDPNNILWNNVDIVFECTGRFLTSKLAGGHIKGSVKKVILSAPPKDDTPVFVIGVNDTKIVADQTIVSNASCTTNCLAPIVHVLDSEFGVINGVLDTVHAVTTGQSVLDVFGTERARSVFNNIIPTTTGAAKTVGKVVPHLEGKLNGGSFRVPVAVSSVGDAVLTLKGSITAKEIESALINGAAEVNKRSPSGYVLCVGDDYQVSADAVASPWSSMVLKKNIMVLPGNGTTLVRVSSFYDNEMGYAHRLAELAVKAWNS